MPLGWIISAEAPLIEGQKRPIADITPASASLVREPELFRALLRKAKSQSGDLELREETNPGITAYIRRRGEWIERIEQLANGSSLPAMRLVVIDEDLVFPPNQEGRMSAQIYARYNVSLETSRGKADIDLFVSDNEYDMPKLEVAFRVKEILASDGEGFVPLDEEDDNNEIPVVDQLINTESRYGDSTFRDLPVAVEQFSDNEDESEDGSKYTDVILFASREESDRIAYIEFSDQRDEPTGSESSGDPDSV